MVKFNVFIFYVVFVCFVLGIINAQECRSYRRLRGKCVTIIRCPPLLAVLRSPQRTVGDIKRLQRLTCITQIEQTDNPLVCCPKSEIVDLDSNNVTQVDASTTTTSKPFKAKNTTNEIGLKLHPNFSLLPSLKVCSYAVAAATSDRVIGGEKVAHGTYPWMARLGYRNKRTRKVEYYCGGTVISKRHILTAAHCTIGYDNIFRLYAEQVRLGEHNTKTDVDCNTDLGNLCSIAEDYKIERIIAHPDYSATYKRNDISIIRVDRDISFESYFIKPVCLPFFKEYEIPEPTNLLGTNATGTVAGWGRTIWSKLQGSAILMDIKLPIVPNSECQVLFKKRVLVTENQICAGGEKGKDSCGGDSGGPLLVDVQMPNQLSKQFQLGIVSFGQVQCGGGLPGVYTRISKYLPWILDNMGLDS